jgi:predicted enzyme related to lactoylglutathione lyase
MYPERSSIQPGATGFHASWWDGARHIPRHIVVALLLGIAYAAGATAASIVLPPLVQPAGTEHHVGKIIWADLVTPDLDASKRFYGGLFGWHFTDAVSGSNAYTVAYVDDRPVAGFVLRATPAGGRRQPVWLTFIAVADVDAARRTALDHGARVLFEPRTYSNRGRQAVLTDPEGATFAVLASSSGDPADVLAEPGEWIWSSLQVGDPATDARFYQALFGYDVFDVPSEDGLLHVILSSDDFARASVNAFPDASPGRHPHWLDFVRVLDAASVASKAVALGGRVLVEPRPDRHGGNVAVIADPNGAPVGIMEWSQTDSTQEPR